MSAHTPGPWRVETFGDYSWIRGQDPGDSGDLICNAPDHAEECMSYQHWEANARLIVAALDLLVALESLVGEWDAGRLEWLENRAEVLSLSATQRSLGPVGVELFYAARAAIAKATSLTPR